MMVEWKAEFSGLVPFCGLGKCETIQVLHRTVWPQVERAAYLFLLTDRLRLDSTRMLLCTPARLGRWEKALLGLSTSSSSSCQLHLSCTVTLRPAAVEVVW